MRHTRGHTRNRRSHHALLATGFILCSECGQPKQKHIACSNCGKYKTQTKTVVAVDYQAKADAKQARKKEALKNENR